MTGSPIRVLLAEDQAMVRGAMAALLSMEDDLDVVGEVRPAATSWWPRRCGSRPDVAVLDIEMPGLDGLSAAAALRSAVPACRVLIVTTFGRPGYLRQAMEAGATGFVLGRFARDRARVCDPACRRGTASRRPGPRAGRPGRGHQPADRAGARDPRGDDRAGTVADIAAAVSLSEGTVRNHLSSAIQKVGARNRAEAARIARDKGWLGPPA